MPEIKSPGVALVLSFLIAGLGQIYNGELVKGILFIVLSLVFWFLSIFLIGIPLYIALWAYSMYDAYKGAQRFNAAHAGQPYPAPGYAGPAPPPGYGAPAAPPYQPAPYAPPMGTSSAQLFCPACGQHFPPAQGKFCPKDGTELRAVA